MAKFFPKFDEEQSIHPRCYTNSTETKFKKIGIETHHNQSDLKPQTKKQS